MSLTGMKVYDQYAKTTFIEMLQENLNLFNAATGGALNLSYGGNNPGNFNIESMYAPVSNLVRARDPYGTGSIAEVTLTEKETNDVKVGRGTPVMKWDLAMFDWNMRNAAEAGYVFGKQLAEDVFVDYLDVMFGSLYAALANDAATNILDKTGSSPDTLTPAYMADAAQLFGDQSGKIALWIMHSKPRTDFLKYALTNSTQLFNWGNVNVMQDAEGRRFVVSDNAALSENVTTPGTLVYNIYGLTSNAVRLVQNDDLQSRDLPVLGNENLAHKMQKEWSFNLSLKGYAWDRTNGGKAPTNAALKINTNWDKWAVSHKDLPGVLLKVN